MGNKNSELYQNFDLKYIAAYGSAAHTYGNLLATAQKWVIDIFPKNLFKTIHVQSKLAHKQMLSTPHQFLKKSKPIIIFKPRIEYDEQDAFLNGTLMTQRFGGPLTQSSPGDIDLQPFFHDQIHGTDIMYSLARRVMYIDVQIIFNTLIQQMNWMDYLYQSVRFNAPFFLETYLESYLPKELMEVVGNLGGVPVHAQDGSVTDFLNYMNSNSCYPVTYKLAGSTGREEFYRYYPTNIVTTLSDLSKDDGETVDHITTNYHITFTVKMEFWSTGTNYVFSPKITSTNAIPAPTDSTLIPVLVDAFNYGDLVLPPGWQVYGHTTCILDKPGDVLDFSPLIQEQVKEVIQYHARNAIPYLNFIDIHIRKNGREIEQGRAYDIDMGNYKIHFHNKSYGFDNYTIIISIDVQYLNQITKEIFNLK